MQDFLFSIVTPSYNSERFIRNCIESVRYACQGIPYEHIIMDGASTDSTLSILKEYPELKVYSEKDKGMYDALNKAIKKAKGTLIGHLNTDEQYNKDGLQQAIKYMLQNTHLDAIMSPTVMLDENLDFSYYLKQIITPTVCDTHWFMPAQSCSLLFKKTMWERIPYDDSLRLVADHVWFRKQMEAGLKIDVCPHPIGIFVWHNNNLSNTEGKKSDENALPDINKKSFYITLVKHYYRLKKLLKGGYIKSPIEFEVYSQGAIKKVSIKKPKLRP